MVVVNVERNTLVFGYMYNIATYQRIWRCTEILNCSVSLFNMTNKAIKFEDPCSYIAKDTLSYYGPEHSQYCFRGLGLGVVVA